MMTEVDTHAVGVLEVEMGLGSAGLGCVCGVMGELWKFFVVSYSIDLKTVVCREKGPIEDKVVPSQLSIARK